MKERNLGGAVNASVAAIIAALGVSAVARAEEPAPAKPAATQTITVDVGTFRNRQGALGCRLYRGPAGFPEGSAGTVEKRVTITANVTRCTFENVAPGTYAIAVMHDENGNQRLDKNFVGIPTEGYSVSNNHTHAMSSPTWDESRFTVEAGKNLGLGIALRY